MSQTFTTRALLFDMDSTLVDSTAVVERVWTQWAAEHDLAAADVLAVIHGRQGHLSMAELLPHRSQEENLADNAVMLARELDELDGVVEIPGAATLLASLGDASHALVTSATLELATARMRAAGLAMPTAVVTAESVTRSKPHPEGFLRAAELLGVGPTDCVVFEDSAFGIEAGLAAGMRVVGVGPTAARHNPTWAVDDLTGTRVVPVPDGLRVTLG
ncbi:HAD-IA family hydrolase [Propioniciclava coleopterorum]|uniref:HAD-IA family hydrolase n=1 Tax=Propioniciclava coleopterorum TaxID=2714937 RepID=A0A6G7Y7K8_9ACTN|nr:HAD-IA family hydrolase [Propioniciclava coleopterorum]QIK72770.1 HAD-IA family hydrolase [Propioniciclava coleopterorum]